jgi:L-alanine-DL-glutamate epimerase-like enolase superfamily enzyme
MTIIGVEVLEFCRKLDGRSWNPTMRWHERRAPLILIHDDAGITGIGEAWSSQSEIARVLDRLGADIAPRLLGNRLDDREQLVAEAATLPSPAEAPWVAAAAASALDIAFWDLAAKARDQPLWRALGGTRGKAHVYASAGLYRDGTTSADLARTLRGFVDGGFDALKMKIGGLPRDDDLARVHAVRAAIGDATVLWVDAVNQLTLATVLDWCAALRDAGVTAIQAPLPFDDLAGMMRVNREGLPVVAGEAAHREADFAALLEAGAVAHLQFCLGLCGGFTGAARLDARAAAQRVTTTPQCSSTAILQAASLQFGAAYGNVTVVEYHEFHDHLVSLLPAAMRHIVGGVVTLDQSPGLGIAAPVPGPQPGGGEIIVHRAVGRRIGAASP